MRLYLFLGLLAFSIAYLKSTPVSASELDLRRTIAVQQAQIELLKKRLNAVESGGERLVQKKINCLGRGEFIAELKLSNGSGITLVQVSEEGYGTGNTGLYSIARNYEGWTVSEISYVQRPGVTTRELKVNCELSGSGGCKLQVNVKDSTGGNGLCADTTLVALQVLNSNKTVEVIPL